MTENGRRLRVMVVGTDARTDAIVAACRRSPRTEALLGFSKSRIPGLVQRCDELHVGDPNDLDAVVAAATEFGADLAIIGPEDPLARGVVDALEGTGVGCFGPRAALARIEASKSFARDLVDAHGIAGNPRHRAFTDAADAALGEWTAELGAFAVKPDGLTGGKGVALYPEHFATMDEAVAYARSCVADGGRVVVEECLEGEEFSLMTITDGVTSVHCPLVQDHKRAFDGDTGPNTGGMGSYSWPDHSMPFLAPDDLAAARAINEAVIAALLADTGAPYRGVLYGGFMATASGVRLIEYNCRFGDPECENVLTVLDTDLVAVAEAVVNGRLADIDVRFAAKATVCKYLVPDGYPTTRDEPGEIVVPDALFDDPNLRFYWAATDQRPDGTIWTTGSRALAVVGLGETMADAEGHAERGAAAVEGPVRHRRDIATEPLLRKRTDHMAALRGR